MSAKFSSIVVPLISVLCVYILNQWMLHMDSDMAKKMLAGKPWADTPIPLIRTPVDETGKDDVFTIGASHMALLHNAILRGYNSIYNQAAVLAEEDYADFIGYCLTWCKFVQTHHDEEERSLFPAVAQVLGKSEEEVWGATFAEHTSFMPGLRALHTYLATLPSPRALSPTKLRSLLAAFREPFTTHFHAEIRTIASLPPPQDPTTDATTRALFKAWGKASLARAGYTDVLPFFLYHCDRTVEGGRWRDWPPMPAPVRWALVHVGGWWHARWWRFASCDAEGVPRGLWAFNREYLGGDGVGTVADEGVEGEEKLI